MSVTLACAGLLYELHIIIFAIPFMALAMGMANNVFVQKGEVSIGVTYMTGTLVKFGQRLAGKLLGESDSNWLPYLLLWIGLVSGAILGSIGYGFWNLHSLWAGVAICTGLAAICSQIESKISHQNVP